MTDQGVVRLADKRKEPGKPAVWYLIRVNREWLHSHTDGKYHHKRGPRWIPLRRKWLGEQWFGGLTVVQRGTLITLLLMYLIDDDAWLTGEMRVNRKGLAREGLNEAKVSRLASSLKHFAPQLGFFRVFESGEIKEL